MIKNNFLSSGKKKKTRVPAGEICLNFIFTCEAFGFSTDCHKTVDSNEALKRAAREREMCLNLFIISSCSSSLRTPLKAV